MSCDNCKLLYPCIFQAKPAICKKCSRKSCQGCYKKCLLPEKQLTFLSEGLSEENIKKLTKIYEGACGSIDDWRREFSDYVFWLVENDLELVMDFYNYTYFYDSKLAIKIRCIYSSTRFEKYFKDYIKI